MPSEPNLPSRPSVGDWVEFDVPEVEGIGPAYTARGRVDRADPGHMLLLADCTDGQEHWRSANEVRIVRRHAGS